MPPRRATLRAFGLVCAAATIAVAWILSATTALRWPVWTGGGGGVALLAVAVLVPSLLRSVYVAWNRAIRVHARRARTLVLRLMHVTILAARRNAGSPLVLHASEAPESLWTPRAASSPGRPEPATLRGWIRHAARRRPWALPLLPYLLLLRWLGPGEPGHQPQTIYTLY